MFKVPGKSYRGPFAALSAEEQQLRHDIYRHLEKLAVTIGERNMPQFINLFDTEKYIEQQYFSMGYKTYHHQYNLEQHTVSNIIAEVPGKEKADEIVIVGAHYDSYTGAIGADDNGSGVAAMLTIANYLAQQKFSRTLRFVAFVNEEPPYFQTKQMGSYQYADDCKKVGDNIVAMLSLEMLGYYSEEPRSQFYPFPFMFFYPSRGNFIAFVANLKSKSLLYNCVEVFRKNCRFPSEAASVPAWIPGVSWSDQWSFWRHGYPAIMVTDTALFRYPHYHTADDTIDKIDFDKLARVTAGLINIITHLLRP